MSPELSPKRDPDARWIDRMKETMAVELSRGMTQGIPPRALITLLFGIPEVSDAFLLRANRRRKLPIEPTTDMERQDVAEALTRVADWLDDGSTPELVAELREIAGGVLGGE